MKGGIWTISGQVVSRVLDLITLMVLARLLEPGDFGLVAISMSVILIAEAILELPTTIVLIVTPQPTDAMLATAFTLGLLRAAVVGLISCIAGFVLMKIYGDPRLFALTSVLAIAPALRGLISPQVAILAQEFKFRPQFVLNVAGKLASLIVAVTIAVLTRSYWSIAAGTVVTPIAMVLLSYRLAPYRPKLSLVAWPMFAGYLGWNAVSQLMASTSWQFDRLLLPRYVTEVNLGLYVTASEIVAVPYKAFAQPIVAPLLAAFSAARSSSVVAFHAAYLRALDILITLMLPILVILALHAEPLLLMVLGPKWTNAAPIVMWLSISAMFGIPRILFVPVFLTLNRPKLVTLVTAIELVVKIPLLVVLVPSMTISGALIAQGAGIAASMVASLWLVHSVAHVRLAAQLRVAARPMVAATAMAVVGYLGSQAMRETTPGWFLTVELVSIAALSCATFFAVVLVAWQMSGRPDGFVRTVLTRLIPARPVVEAPIADRR